MKRVMGAVCAAAIGAAIIAPGAWAQDQAAAFDREHAPTTWSHPAYATAWDQYQARKAAANGGAANPPEGLNWDGVWENARFQGYSFSLRPGEKPTGRGLATQTTMKLTPRYAAELEARVRKAEAHEDFDPITWCLPDGYPRWLSALFLKEFAPQPGKTLMINEQENEIRRIYTDGRGHMSEEFAYPLWEGDSVGFWDGDTLVVNTTNLKHNQIGREQPAISEQAETVEEWTRVAPDVIRVKGTLYDPEALEEPFDFVRYYSRTDEKDGAVRALFDACPENQVFVNKDGQSDLGAIPGVDAGPNLSDAETWLLFDESEASGLAKEFEDAAAKGEPYPFRKAPAKQ